MDHCKNKPVPGQIIEPPPDLPLYGLGAYPRPKEVHSKKFVNKLKGWFSGHRNDELNIVPDYFIHGKQIGFKGNGDQRELTSVEGNEIEAFPSTARSQDVNRFPIQDSAKTFLTGNNVNANHIPQFPSKENNEEAQLIRKDSMPEPDAHVRALTTLDGKRIPMSLMINEPPKLSSLTGFVVKSRNITVRKLIKRLNSVANKKQECSRLTQKFLKDLAVWGQRTSMENIESQALVDELQELFEQDAVLEQKISDKLKILTKELEFVGRRENELSEERSSLLAALKKYENTKDYKGEFDEETTLCKERVMAHQKSFETYHSNYQYAVSVGARQLFKEVAIEYYERASDLKEHSGNYLQTALKTLETKHNNEVFLKDLDKLRMLRAERNWTKLKPEQKNDPRSWVNLVSGKHDYDDTLMRKVYDGLPVAYTPMPKASPKKTPQLDFRTGLEESFSAIGSDRFNPITSNEFFSGKPPEKEDDENETFYETVKVDQSEANNVEDTVPRSLNPNVLNRENNTRNLNVKTSLRRSSKNHALREPEIADNVLKHREIERSNDGFILNFGEISRQFYDAEMHLEENKWDEASG